MGCGPERILGLWPRIGVKHVAFYGLWPGMTSLELWLGIAEEHEEPLSCGLGWRVLPVLCSYLGTSLGVTEGNESSARCISIHGSGHVIEME
ncbi:hypothetical protein DEO72_LG1g2345 [Vigna unguiculata]|uniref:Uncharacterized protein n=1 Tax=Vigna unguiculata TaxID=3917 RepID=A0A4D6KU16_VIGUN|nr:hypothetical protein DEO72_LG1g2345 [Vigna unguiculata]